MIKSSQGHPLGAALGLLALALIVLAPLFSQLRAAPQEWSWLAELACHDGVAQAPEQRTMLPQASMLDACGYCSLLIHSPALGGHVFALAVHAPHAALSPVQWRGPRLALRFPAAQSRAPPAALV
ncbi:DUF2946 family protein [Pseudomonas sp.]|uniref:DUF2946 family protein n=1 Tax=Pseudomonas sp. TaxID=306 RepID=UPI002730C671|nr:DUF2946 family protein [Pseudomonas sp.]MDP2244346.1 DUF2946 family protein [Pseudomonas sp.]